MASADGPKTHPLILVDSMNLVFRSHWALRQLTNDEGVPTGVLYGVLRTVRRLHKTIGPRIVFCWDNGIPGDRRRVLVRRSEFATYKSQRTPSEDSAVAYSQIPPLFQVLSLLGYAHAGIPGAEADDLIALLSAACTSSDVVICSNDRDMYQLLVSPRVRILVPQVSQSKLSWVTAASVQDDWGIPVEKWAWYLALGGDSSDSIKPVRGMGPKTARRLLELGANPTLPFSKNPASLKQSSLGEKYEAHWSKIQQSLRMAKLPSTASDFPVNQLFRTGTAPSILVDEYQGPCIPQSAREQRIAEFTAWCARYQLLEFLSIRREFFS